MSNLIASSIVRLAVSEYFKGRIKKVTPFLTVKLSSKFKKDLVKTHKELGYDSAKGMVWCELNLL